MPLPQNVLAKNVIDWFQGINLRVCDDAALIESSIKSLEQGKRSLTNRPGDERIAAQLWFKHCNLLRQDRAAAIDLVYTGMYRSSADLGLAGDMSKGAVVMTAELYDAFLNLARKQCNTDDTVARRFVEKYMTERGLKLNAPLPRENPASIANFRATSTRQGILLSCNWPQKNCKDIRILRTELPDRGTVKTIWLTHDTSYSDGDVRAGVRYVYHAAARLPDAQGRDQFGTESVVRAPALGEVEDCGYQVQESGAVLLTWRSPAPGATVHIFRAAGAPPEYTVGPSEPEAEGPAERVGFTTTEKWVDDRVRGGATYYYRFVVDFGQDVYTEGKVVSVWVPAQPDPPERLLASHRFNLEKDEVNLSWVVKSGRNESYTLVRRDGLNPPAHEKDGTVLHDKKPERQFTDTSVQAGHWYSYAVFTFSANLKSRSPATAAPVLIRSEVTGLKAVPGNARVDLAWTQPAAVERVIVRRSRTDYPRTPQDGEELIPLRAGAARDEKLPNGMRHFYRVWCVYSGQSGGKANISDGVTAWAEPEAGPQLPPRGQDLKFEHRGGEVWLSWRDESRRNDFLLRSKAPPQTPAPGEVFPKTQLSQLGEMVLDDLGSKDGRRIAVDRRPDLLKPIYTLYTSSADRAVRGESVECLVIPDARGLRVESLLGQVSLRWEWPPDCREVVVARRENAWPENAEDNHERHQSRWQWTRDDYSRAGDKFVDILPPGDPSSRYHYIVYAISNGPAGRKTAPGADPGCRFVVDRSVPMNLTYRVGHGAASGKKGFVLNWEIDRCLPDFAGFLLVAHNEQVPESAGSGIELYRNLDGCAQGNHQALVSLAPVRTAGWHTFFCKMFPLDQRQAAKTLIIHPDTTRQFDHAGAAQWATRPSPPRTYRHGVPATVICPFCFTEYRFHEMQFAFDPSGPRMRGRYSWLDRLLPPGSRLAKLLRRRHVIKPPMMNGRPAPCKFCPKGDIQPRTAGFQSSLTVGLIGAKFSGKTHFIASLVKRLEDRVMLDYRGSLVPASTETTVRALDMTRRLFGDRLPLDVTSVKTPPLIYDFEVQGSDAESSRNTNLVLYDTAGENLQSDQVAREMVQYLRVAAGVIFLIDPLQIEGVRRLLPPASVMGDVDDKASPGAIVGNVLGLLEEGRVVASDKPLPTPVAVVLTKCDVLRDHKLLEPNRLWGLEGRRHAGRFNRVWHEDMSGMIGEFLRRRDPAAYQTIVRRFPNNAFFGVSATGCAPDARGRYPFLSPWRVEDPLLWLLSQIGVVQATPGPGDEGEAES